jgi:hypothetical protein
MVGCASALLLAPLAGKAAELLRNGSFDNVLVDWAVAEILGDWLPYQYPAGNIAIQTSINNYNGLLISQPLNVTGVANQQVQATIDLQAPWGLAAANTVALYLEYLDNTGSLHRIKILNPDDSTIPAAPSSATYTENFTFPANATKLTRLTLENEAQGQILADNIHLTSATLAPGVLPHLGTLSSNAAAYGQTLTLTGSGFDGATAPVVLLNGSAEGLSITGWTAHTITAAVNEPAASGNLIVVIDGTPTVERRHLDITSPHLVVAIPEARHYAVFGQTVGVDVQIGFRNGFAPTAPGVQMQILKNGSAFGDGAFAPAQVPREGGTRLTVNTTNLSVGQNTLQVRTTYGAFVIDTFFDIVIEMPANMWLYKGREIATNPLVFDSQSSASGTVKLVDADGKVLKSAPPLTWSSSNTAVLKVFTGSLPWDGTSLLANNNGDAVLHITGPGTLHYQFPVHVELPASPRVVACQLASHSDDNSGSSPENSLYYEFTEPITGFSWGCSEMGLLLGEEFWGSDNMSYTGRFRVPEGQLPGHYLITAASNDMASADVLTVVNAANKGMVTGHVKTFGDSSGDTQGLDYVNGTLEFYNAGTGKLSLQRNIDEWSDTYHAAYVEPGSYKLRWVSVDGLSQWYPLANSDADATPVVITAGTTTADIQFFFTKIATPVSPPVLAGPPTHDIVTHTFGLPVLTDSINLYQLQKSNNLLEGSWFNLGDEVPGDDSVQIFQDSAATGPNAFYRVLKR